jgi:glycosyltransferase involved in cell wall biosynthesis
MPAISVIICTHNPRADYLRRTLEALKAQTLPKEQWELLLIDNNSKEPVSAAWDLSWHPQGRHIHEMELGLTNARLRGIRESAAELLMFVDDDNVLAPDYLSHALNRSLSHDYVGAFGGNITAEFESKPEDWISAVLPILAIVNVTHEQWICSPGTGGQMTAPCGAGLVIRKAIAVYYADKVRHDPLRRGLDRKGASLSSAGDIDMSLCACALGMAVGRFPELRLTHLISSGRLKQDYILRLVEEAVFSDMILKYIWNGKMPEFNGGPLSGADKLFRSYKNLRFRLSHWRRPNFFYEHMLATNRGLNRAAQFINSDDGKNGTVKQ